MRAHPTDGFPRGRASGWKALPEPVCPGPNRAIAKTRYSTPWMRPGGRRPPPPSSSSATAVLWSRWRWLFAERRGCFAAGEPALDAGLPACGCRSAIVPNARTDHRRMHSFRYAPGSRPIRWPTAPRPDEAQADAAMTHTSYQPPVHPGSHTICQPLARARQPRHDCAEWNLDYVGNLLVRQFFQLSQNHHLAIVNGKPLQALAQSPHVKFL